FQKVIQRWFADYDQFKHIYEMYFQTIYTKQTLAFNFLSLAQALDSYTNIYCRNLLQSGEINKAYKKFGDRILVLLKSFVEIRGNLSLQNFTKAIVETRHAISHGDSKQEKEKNPFCYEDNDLRMLFFGAKMILSAVFLRKIGFSDEKIYESLKNNGRFGNIVVGKYKFEEKKIEKVK
ncbi:MAG: hypothetical protein JXR48_14065, partial [Candidatus Delongbacteria bacterium]|nr:hypothetical protein [Candidatus Delongbacteria bacterium]